MPALGWCGAAKALPRLDEVIRDAGFEPFPVNLCGIGRTKDGVVFVKVDEGGARLSELNERFTAALTPPPALERPPYIPVLGLGRAPTASRAEFLQRQAAGHLAPQRFPVEHLSILVEDSRGLWHERHRLPLVA